MVHRQTRTSNSAAVQQKRLYSEQEPTAYGIWLAVFVIILAIKLLRVNEVAGNLFFDILQSFSSFFSKFSLAVATVSIQNGFGLRYDRYANI